MGRRAAGLALMILVIASIFLYVPSEHWVATLPAAFFGFGIGYYLSRQKKREGSSDA